MVKLKIECWWTDPGSIRRRFLSQFVPETDLEQYNFTLEDDYEYLVVFNFTDPTKIKVGKDRVFVFSQEPVWSPNDSKDSHLYSSNSFVADLRAYPPSISYREILLPMLYGGRGDLDHREEWNWGYTLFSKDFSKEKVHSISAVISNTYNSHLYHLSNPDISEILYKWRVDTGIMLATECPFLQVWGTFQPENTANMRGVAWNKLIALRDFRFSICIENSIQKNYISEKFWDAILTDTVPVYLGCSNIEEYIDPKCFIDLRPVKDDPKALKHLIDEIHNNSEDLYREYLPYIQNLKQQYRTDKRFNVWERIKYEIKTHQLQ